MPRRGLKRAILVSSDSETEDAAAVVPVAEPGGDPDSNSDSESDFAEPEAMCTGCGAWICLDCGHPEGEPCVCAAAESDSELVEWGSDDEGLCRCCQVDLDESGSGSESESESGSETDAL